MAVLAQSAPAQPQFDELRKRHLPGTADRTNAVANGDVDGDGDLDLVFGNDRQDRLYLNDGTGIFTDATATRMPVDSDSTGAVVLGDVDGDGDLDLVSGNGAIQSYGSGEQDRLYLNDGTGKFTDVTAARMPVDSDSTGDLALGDVDGDGDLDLVLAFHLNLGGGSQGGGHRIYLNNGKGTFADTADVRPVYLGVTRAVALGDVDGDGDLDLMLSNDRDYYGYQSYLLLNDGRGMFTWAPAALPIVKLHMKDVAFGDMDGDGDLDLVLGSRYEQAFLYLNNGTGTFTDATAGRIPGRGGSSVAIGDVDGDGDPDLVFGGGQNLLYLNDGTGTFTGAMAAQMPLGGSVAVALGDVDGDSDVDLVFNWGQNRLHLNDGTGTFTDATAARLPIRSVDTRAVALGDVDGDGDLDLVSGNEGQRNFLYLNDGTDTFTDATAARMPIRFDRSRAVAIGDVDGDGDLDLVFGNYNQQDSLYLNDGTGTFTDVTAARMPFDSDFTQAVALGDVDGDGDPDLVFGNGSFGSGQQNRLYLNDGTGTFTFATAALPFDRDYTFSVALGDVDGDGDLDLVFGNRGQQNRLYLNDGTGTFTDATAARMPVDSDNTQAVALGDVDGDGDPDLVFGNSSFGSGQQNRLYLNDGTGTFTDATTARMPVDSDKTWAVALGDVDGDSDPDLVLGNNYGQQNRLYLNDGTGTYTDATATRMPVASLYTTSLAIGDVDGDGDLDLVFGSRYDANRLYLNLLRQFDAPFLLRVGYTYQLDGYARYGPATAVEVVLPFLSTGTANLPLPPLGTLGIDPNNLLSLPAFLIPASGMASVTIAVPNYPWLAGLSIYGQALLVQVPIQQRLTNVIGDVIWRL